MIYDSRLGPKTKRVLSPKAKDRPFKFWFSTTAELQAEDSLQRETLAEVEKLVKKLVDKSDGQLTATFNENVKLTLTI